MQISDVTKSERAGTGTGDAGIEAEGLANVSRPDQSSERKDGRLGYLRCRRSFDQERRALRFHARSIAAGEKRGLTHYCPKPVKVIAHKLMI
jgi:hypothetical protein